MKTVPAVYRERFRVCHLGIDPGIQGAVHQFTFEGRAVALRLPAFDPMPTEFAETAEIEADSFWLETNQPERFIVKMVTVELSAGDVPIPTTAAAYPAINMSLYEDADRKRLDTLSDSHYFAARRAIDYWLRVVRWKTLSSDIDLLAAETAHVSDGILVNLETGRPFWTPRITRSVEVEPVHVVDRLQWDAIQAELAAGRTPPVWYDFLFSAEGRLTSGDLNAAILDAAIACEAVIRALVSRHLSDTAPEWMRVMLTKINMSELLNEWPHLGFWDATRQAELDLAAIQNLTRIRNVLMHRGADDRIRPGLCRDLCAATRRLILRGEPILETRSSS